MIQHLPFILHNAMRNRRRSLLTIASMGVSLCLLGLLLSLYRGLFMPEDSSPAAARRLIVRHRVSLMQVMPVSYKERIKSIPGVVAVTSWQWFGGTYKDARDSKNFFARFVADPKEMLEVRPEMVLSAEQREAFLRQRTSCIATNSLMKKLGWKMGERVTLVGDIFPVTVELKLVGSYDEPDGSENLFFHWDYLQEALPPGNYRDVVGAFLVLVDSPEHVPQVTKAIDAKFANSPAQSKSESEHDFILSFVAFLGNLKLFLAAVCSAVTFTILLVCANTVAMTVRERTRETAILRTLGFGPVEIFALVLGEAGLLGVIGGGVGATLAWGVSVAFRKWMAGQFPFPILGVDLGLVLILAGLVIAVASAAAPAWFASRQNVVESLRYAG